MITSKEKKTIADLEEAVKELRETTIEMANAYQILYKKFQELEKKVFSEESRIIRV